MKRKKDRTVWPSWTGIWIPDFDFSCEVRSKRSNQNKLLKEIGLYPKIFEQIH